MVRLRPVRADELAELTELCLRSKAVWGYDAAFMAACRSELTLRPRDLDTPMRVAETECGEVVGLAQIRVDGSEAELARLFIEPGLLRTGAGRMLFTWAVDEARRLGAARMTIEADPDAAPFYQRMGARRDGEAPSGSIPGRMLPRFVVTLRD
jgi:GNAT superfamily N-acetyltransferase